MEPTKTQLVKVRLQGIRRAAEKARREEKGGFVSIPLAENFNSLLGEVGDVYPTVKDALPKRIEATTDFRMMGLSDVNYLDLDVFVEQVLGIIELMESGG